MNAAAGAVHVYQQQDPEIHHRSQQQKDLECQKQEPAAGAISCRTQQKLDRPAVGASRRGTSSVSSSSSSSSRSSSKQQQSTIGVSSS